MTALFWLAVVVSLFGTHALCFVAGHRTGAADTESALLDALNWLAEHNEDHDRRMRGA